MGELEVSVVGNEIVVPKPGTDFLLGYRRLPDEPQLVVTRDWSDPGVTSPAASEFQAQAVQAAVRKAR
jgi:hypothetical protein